DQEPLLHDRLGLEPDLCACRDRGAQHVACGQLYEPPAGRDLLGLGSLPRPRRAQQDQYHMRLVAPRSFAFLISPSYWCANRWLWIWATVSMVTLTAISSEVPPK